MIVTSLIFPTVTSDSNVLVIFHPGSGVGVQVDLPENLGKSSDV